MGCNKAGSIFGRIHLYLELRTWDALVVGFCTKLQYVLFLADSGILWNEE